MAKDPAFLFYPGDYLKDTQCLSEKAQVAYDRIMCEHMRNISEHMINIGVSKERLNFFTKRLNDDEKSELMHTLVKIPTGFHISWVAESICKRKSYSNSRSNNRTKNKNNISTSYDNHMENANEYVYITNTLHYNILVPLLKNFPNPQEEKQMFYMLIPEMMAAWKKQKPGYFENIDIDYPALLTIAYKICSLMKWQKSHAVDHKKAKVLEKWGIMVDFISAHKFFKELTLNTISNDKNWQNVVNALMEQQKQTKQGTQMVY
jgi:hypothetical protein